MILDLIRLQSDAETTLGRLLIDGGPKCYTLEDAHHVHKIPGRTRIPAGRYNLTLRADGPKHEQYLRRFGPSFHKGMLWIRDIPGFEYVYIHIGNYNRDTLGCPLVGLAYAKDEAHHFMTVRSEDAYRLIYPPICAALANRVPVSILVTDEPKEEENVASNRIA